MEKLTMCRVCLAEGIRMYSIASTHLREVYEALTLKPFETNDIRPIQVCYICCARLQNCYQFRNSCLQNEEMFSTMLNSNEFTLQTSGTQRLTIDAVVHLSIGGALQGPMEFHKVKEECAWSEDDGGLEQSDTRLGYDTLGLSSVCDPLLEIVKQGPQNLDNDDTAVEQGDTGLEYDALGLSSDCDSLLEIGPDNSDTGPSVPKKPRLAKQNCKDMPSSNLKRSDQTKDMIDETKTKEAVEAKSVMNKDLTLSLETTPDGQLLLKHNPEQPLREQYRKILVRAISKEILRHDPKSNVTAEIYLSWLQEINTTKNPITQEEEECLEWLGCPCDDYALCAEKWQRTSEERKQRVLSNENQSYLQEFPCLKRSWGHELITADFDRWYPKNEHSLDDKLPLLKSKLISLSKTSSRQSLFVEELKQLAQDQDSETSNLAALLLIPHMIGPVHMKWKRISAAEVRESFILHVEEENWSWKSD